MLEVWRVLPQDMAIRESKLKDSQEMSLGCKSMENKEERKYGSEEADLALA